jgi:hypothetical protein
LVPPVVECVNLIRLKQIGPPLAVIPVPWLNGPNESSGIAAKAIEIDSFVRLVLAE